ncbi:hypothetical protein [Nocardia sp. BMG51109]|uniref:hypothetical protein n=1 Tax=Nocardia sp. BMG51109 TaxID=1056816 RepID=UPI0004AFDE99|nr:hypothetical protein [Nocardia sp. BMG51109]
MTGREKFELPVPVDDSLVYGAPHQTADGSTVITVSRPGLFRPGQRPVGVFVVHEGKATWTAADDSTRIALLAVLTGFVSAAAIALAVLRRPPWPDMSFHRTEVYTG